MRRNGDLAAPSLRDCRKAHPLGFTLLSALTYLAGKIPSTIASGSSGKGIPRKSAKLDPSKSFLGTTRISLSNLSLRGLDSFVSRLIWKRDQASLRASRERVHYWASRHSLGFEDEYLGSSPGWWAATVATYCPSRSGELSKFLSSKPCE